MAPRIRSPNDFRRIRLRRSAFWGWMKIDIDVVSDAICPWCYVGKRRLEKAIAAVRGKHEVTVRWKPFQLNPAMPKEGMGRKEYRERKFGS